MRHSALGAPVSFDGSGTLKRWGVPLPSAKYGVSEFSIEKMKHGYLMNKKEKAPTRGTPKDWNEIKTVSDGQHKKKTGTWGVSKPVMVTNTDKSGINKPKNAKKAKRKEVVDVDADTSLRATRVISEEAQSKATAPGVFGVLQDYGAEVAPLQVGKTGSAALQGGAKLAQEYFQQELKILSKASA